MTEYAATYQIHFTDGSQVVGHALPGEVSPFHCMEQGRPFFLYQQETHWDEALSGTTGAPTVRVEQRRLIINPNSVCYLKEMT